MWLDSLFLNLRLLERKRTQSEEVRGTTGLVRTMTGASFGCRAMTRGLGTTPVVWNRSLEKFIVTKLLITMSL